MESNWNALPANNLHQIFQYCEVFDVEKCLFVCKNWYDEADYFLKDKVWFVADYVKNIHDVMLSRRRFEMVHVKLDDIENTELDVFLALKRRNLKNSTIKEAIISYKEYKSLSEVLKLLGKHLKKLTLKNNADESISAPLDFADLSSVEELSIENIEANLYFISQKFKNLKCLKLFPKYFDQMFPINLIQDFLVGNPSLRNLALNNQLPDKDIVSVLLPHETSRNLKELKLGYIYYNKAFAEIANNFNNLEVLEIGFMSSEIQPKFVKNLFEMTSLKKLALGGRRETSFWEELFSITPKNLQITNLAFNRSFIEESTLISVINCFPNVRSFECKYLQTHSMRMFREMAQKWRQLRYLNLCFAAFSWPGETNSREPCEFENLTRLDLSAMTFHYPEFVSCFKAPNLKYLHLDEVITVYKPHKLVPNLNMLGENCPNIRRFDLTGEHLEVNAVKFFPLCFKNLKTFYVLGQFTNPVMIESEIIKIFVGYMRKNIRILFDERKCDFAMNEFGYPLVVNHVCRDGVVEFRHGIIKRILCKGKEILFYY